MPLSAGTRIGPYEITAPIGAGGMGEVHRATDGNLGRAAAIKVLPETFALDADRVAHFEREARTLASLNHPNIAQVFGLEKGAYLAVSQSQPGRFNDVMVLEVERSSSGNLAPGAIEPVLTSPASEGNARFSPDGRWLAFASNESGRNEVYVQPFPGPGGKWQASTAGGNAMEWSSARQEPVYADPTGVQMVVPYRTNNGAFAPGGPKPWPGSTPSPAALGRGWSLHPDGERLVIEPPNADGPPIDRVTLVTRLSDHLRALSHPRP